MGNASSLRNSRRRIANTLVIGFVLMLLASTGAVAQTVVSRARVGGYAEDIAFVASGPLKDKIVMIDGFEVMAVANEKKPKDVLTTIFSLKIPEFDLLPTGFTYIESEGLFAFASDTNFKKLYLFDSAGVFKATRNIQYLNPAYAPQHFEGMGYIPLSSPTFPDHLMVVVLDDLAGSAARIEIMRRDGVVVSELFNPAWPAEFASSLGDVTYLGPDRLAVSVYGAGIWTMDFNGNIISGPVSEMERIGEGIVRTSDGRIVAANWPQSLLFFDSNLNRQPESDRHDVVGLNLNFSRGLAWNSDTNQLLFLHNTTGLFINDGAGIAAVPASLDSATQVVDLSAYPFARQVTYLPSEHLIAMTNANPRKIVLFNSDGTVNSEIALTPAAIGQNLGPPNAITYIPTTNEFVVSFNGAGSDPNRATVARTLFVFSRTGTLLRSFDLKETGTGGIGSVAYYFDPDGDERFIIGASAGRVVITDLNGNSRNASGFLIREFNNRAKLGLIERAQITAITSGPMAGAFAILGGRSNEVVIFRLD